jgi:hypothetical protein
MIPPRLAIALTAAGVLPFGAAALMALGLWPWSGSGVALAQAYGGVILAFMSGVLWGFAAKGRAAWAYVLSVLPALHMFFTVPHHPWRVPGDGLAHLIAGFVAVLVLDAVYVAQGLAPRWWLWLRIPVTLAVVACLITVRHA